MGRGRKRGNGTAKEHAICYVYMYIYVMIDRYVPPTSMCYVYMCVYVYIYLYDRCACIYVYSVRDVCVRYIHRNFLHTNCMYVRHELIINKFSINFLINNLVEIPKIKL